MPGNKTWFDGRKAAYAGLLLLGCVVCGCGEPGASGELTQTPVPTVTMAPQPTYTTKPTATESPELPTVTPFDTPTVEPTLAATPTMTTAPTEEPTMAPTVTPTMIPTETVTPSALPTVTPTTEPTETVTPSPEPTLTPPPVPTVYPEYDTLIQNGWQRTGDFFGMREVYFSGMFDAVELLAVTGRYEYRYTASADSAVIFSLIGEEGADVHGYVEELRTLYPECLVTAEGEADYSYRYDAEGQTVSGRVYDCTRGEQKNRMRAELRYPAENDNNGNEGYGFYLK